MTADNFTEAARAEAFRVWFEEPTTLDTISELGAHMAEWARTHLAAQAPEPIPDESELEVVGEWLVVRNVQEPEYPAGPEYGPYPYSDAAPLVHLTQVAGFPPEPQEPTDAEVEAAARALDLEGAVYAFNGDRTAAEADVASRPLRMDSARGEELQIKARAALSAARAARRDEEER